MKLNILDGYLKKQLDLINDDKSDIESLEYEFLQNIWIRYYSEITQIIHLKKKMIFLLRFVILIKK